MIKRAVHGWYTNYDKCRDWKDICDASNFGMTTIKSFTDVLSLG